MTSKRPDRWWETAFTSFRWRQYLELEKKQEAEK